jgi:hypothetical protein
MHALPVLVEELVRQAGLLVEEDHGAEVGLLVGGAAKRDFGEREGMHAARTEVSGSSVCRA